MRFNGISLTDATIKATRQHFADIHTARIREVQNGAVKLPSHVSESEYFASCGRHAQESLNGMRDNSVTFLQRAYWIQTGKDVALLP